MLEIQMKCFRSGAGYPPRYLWCALQKPISLSPLEIKAVREAGAASLSMQDFAWQSSRLAGNPQGKTQDSNV